MDLKLELISVPVADTDRAKTFYTEQLGFIYFTTSAPAKTTELVKSIRANTFADPEAEATK